MRLFKRNSNKAFELIYEEYYSWLLAVSINIVGSYEVAEDLLQEIFIKIYKEQRYKYIKNYESYLYLCIKNASLNYLKDRKIETQVEDSLIEENDNSLVEEIKEYLYLLPLSCREIFEKIVFEHWTYDSVAYDRNISVNTVKTQMLRAKKILRKKIT
ncbi:MAG: sigma-70 family RNA polymerase sigma factor [Carboxylicivirga sp.]|nr:sigma-70 family RNA polymerase sigma factor [Carboxylicivirga sp.]